MWLYVGMQHPRPKRRPTCAHAPARRINGISIAFVRYPDSDRTGREGDNESLITAARYPAAIAIVGPIVPVWWPRLTASDAPVPVTDTESSNVTGDHHPHGSEIIPRGSSADSKRSVTQKNEP